MKSYLTQIVFTFVLALSTLLSISASYAFDEQLALKKFQTYAQDNNLIFTFGSVEKPDYKTLIIKNVDYYDDKTKQRQQIETITLGNVREPESGILHYDTIELSKFTQKGKSQGNDINVSIESIISTGLKFSDDADTSQVLWPKSTALAEVTNMVVEVTEGRGKTVITFPSATAKNIEQKGIRSFTAQSVELAPASGVVNTRGETVEMSLGTVKVENMEQFGIQGLNIGLMNIGALTINTKAKTGEAVNFVFEGMSIENFFSPDLSVEDMPIFSDKDLRAEIRPLTVTSDGKTIMGWKRGFATSTNDKSSNTVTSNGSIEGMYVDFNQMPKNPNNAELLKTLEELSLLTMVLNFQGKGSWQRDSGILDITDYNIELEDGAAFQMSARLSGYTEQVARQFSQAITNMNAEADQKKKNALAFQAMAYLAGLSFERLQIVLDDNSLLDRVINVQAKRLKQEPDQIKGLVGPMTKIMLTPYNIPQLADQASTALGTFMQGNKKLTVTAEPINGLAVTEMMALASGARAGSVTPSDLATRLNLTIVAE